MKKLEVNQVLRAAGRIAGEKQFIISGSQESEVVPIYQETRFLRDLVVQLHGNGIRLMRLPVDPSGTRRLRPLINGLDERTPNTPSARHLRRE